MQTRVQIVSIIVAGGMLLLVLELVRRRRLMERYALLWLLSAAVLLGLAAWRGALVKISHALGVSYPPNALFFVAFGFVLFLLLHFSAAMSRLSDQSKVLAQRLAILEERLLRAEEAAQAEAGSGWVAGDAVDEDVDGGAAGIDRRRWREPAMRDRA